MAIIRVLQSSYPLGFELLPSGDFTEVLVPGSMCDIIDYHFRECVRREVRMRLCKNYGRYFAVMGAGTWSAVTGFAARRPGWDDYDVGKKQLLTSTSEVRSF